MPLQPGPLEPGAGVTSVVAMAADITTLLTAVTGRRITGFQAAISTVATPVTARFRILRGLSLQEGTTNIVATCELTTQMPVTFANYGPGGVDCSGGACVDWIAGNPNLSVFFIDVS